MNINQNYDALFEAPLESAPLRRTPAGWGERLARWVSVAFAPPLVSAMLMLMAAAALATPQAWLGAGVYILIAIIVPALFVAWLVSQGIVADFDLSRREQRLFPYLAIVIYNGLALAILIQTNAPQLLATLSAASLAEIILLCLVTLRWKISVHSAAITSLAVLAWVILGSGALFFGLVVPLVVWARLRLRRHTLNQTLAGACLGGLIFALVFYVYPFP